MRLEHDCAEYLEKPMHESKAILMMSANKKQEFLDETNASPTQTP